VDLDTLAKASDFVGGIVLVVSLVYLAYQVRQNTQSLRSENYARVLERMSTVQAQLSMDADLHHVFMVGAEDPARLSRAERVRFSWALYEMFGAGEFMFHQARERRCHLKSGRGGRLRSAGGCRIPGYGHGGRRSPPRWRRISRSSPTASCEARLTIRQRSSAGAIS
jgi:hypothetical protein